MIKKAKHPTNKLERLHVKELHEFPKKTKASYVRLVKERVKDEESKNDLRRAYDKDQYYSF